MLLKCLLTLLLACLCTEASGTESVYDTRSDLARQIYGYPEESLNIEKPYLDQIKGPLSSVTLLVDNPQQEALCKSDISCVHGDLPEAFKTNIIFPETVTFPALKLMLEQNRILLLDVRRPDELVSPGRIPGSVNVPLQEIPGAFQLSPEQFKEQYGFPLPSPSDKNIVLTCRSGRRILVAQEKMKTLGYNHLRLYRGSFKDWAKNGGEIVFDEEKEDE